MPNWANRFLQAATVACLATPALATPPQTVDVTDHLFARNADTLFLLRDMTDNHGWYSVLQTDTLLVFRNLAIGDDRGFQTIQRVIERHDDTGSSVEEIAQPNTVNPYQMRADQGAWPLAVPDHDSLDSRYGDFGIILLDDGDILYSLSAEAIQNMVNGTLAASRGVLPVIYMEGGVDPFNPDAFDVTQECEAGDLLRLTDYPDDPALAELICVDDHTGQRARLWLVIPRND